MKTTTKLITASLLAASVSVSTMANDLNVTFKQLETHKGNLMVALYNSEANYQGQGKPLQVASIPVHSEKVSYTFENLEAGTYAIKLYHDANNNGKMDTNMFGIPKEGYGFSNNVGRFGEPAFSEASFEVLSESSIEIIVR